MSSVRDVIIESCARSNVCPRKREIPADLFTSAFNLFKGILQEYSNNGFIVAYQNDIDFNPTKTRYVVGKETENTDLVLESVERPYRVYYRPKGAIDWVPMTFKAYNQFFTATNGDFIVSWKPLEDNLYEIIFKERFIPLNPQCKLVYNVEMEFNDNDVISLPSQYIELLTRALAYKLAIEYPRQSGDKADRLFTDLDKLEKQIMADNSNDMIITRESNGYGSLQGDFLGGMFIQDAWY